MKSSRAAAFFLAATPSARAEESIPAADFISKIENRLDFYTRLEKFLAKHIGN